jgi:hypothetical protein
MGVVRYNTPNVENDYQRQPRSKLSAAARDRACESFSGGFEAVCNCPHGPNLACRLCYGNRDRIGVDIQTQKAYFTHDQLLSYAALRRFCCLSFAA